MKSANFVLTENTKINVFGIKLFQIKSTKTFKNKNVGEIKKDTLGGWVSGDARVYGNAWVYGDAEVYGDARVYGKLKIDFVLCSRFNFEFDWQVKIWINKEKEYLEEVKNYKVK